MMKDAIYILYLIPFVMSAFLAYRFFYMWMRQEVKQRLILKLSILFFIVTIIYMIAAVNADHSLEVWIMGLSMVGIGIFLSEVLPHRDIVIIYSISCIIIISLFFLS